MLRRGSPYSDSERHTKRAIGRELFVVCGRGKTSVPRGWHWRHACQCHENIAGRKLFLEDEYD